MYFKSLLCDQPLKGLPPAINLLNLTLPILPIGNALFEVFRAGTNESFAEALSLKFKLSEAPAEVITVFFRKPRRFILSDIAHLSVLILSWKHSQFY
jgi:hypothetical protein